MWPEKLKNWLFSTFFNLFVSNGPVHLWKWFSASRYLSRGTNCVIIGHLAQILALEMAVLATGHIYRLRCTWEVLKSDPKARYWCSLSLGRDFGICQVVSKCLLMFLRHLGGVKNDPEQKMSFFSPNPLLKTAISWFDFCRYKPLTFWWFQCIFLTNW